MKFTLIAISFLIIATTINAAFTKDGFLESIKKLCKKSFIGFDNLSKENKLAYFLLFITFWICYATELTTLFGVLIAVYAVFFNTMSNEYNARNNLIADLTNKATDHLKEFKDATLARQAIRMQLLPKPHYFQIWDVLTYKANRGEYCEKRLRIEIDRRAWKEGKFRIFIDNKEVEEYKYSTYLAHSGGILAITEWAKIYQMLDLRTHSVEFIKKYVVGLVKSGFYEENSKTRADLSHLWLHKSNLENSQLQNVDLSYSHLQKANLSGANLQKAILIGVNLQMASLTKTDLREAVVIRTDFKGAKIISRTLEEILLDPKISDRDKSLLPRFSRLEKLKGAIFHEDPEIDQKMKEKLIEAEEWKLEREKRAEEIVKEQGK